MSRSSPSGPPPMLIRLYGAGKVLRLRDLLLELSKSSRDAEALREILLLHRAIEATLQSQQGKTNVLCYGYRKKRPSNTGRQLHGVSDTETFYTNSIADSLLSPAWQLLLSRIGDTLMLYLLLHVSMFSCLANDCCLQLTGQTMVQVAREWKRVSTLPGIALDPKGGGGLVGAAEIPSERGKRAAAAAAAAAAAVIIEGSRNLDVVVDAGRGGGVEQVARLPAPFHLGPATQDPGELFQSPLEEHDTSNVDNADIINPLQDGVGERVEGLLPVIKKVQARPSSWQRRKARRAADEANMQMEVDPGSTADTGTGGTAGGHTERYGGLPSTQPSSTVDASAVTSSNPQMSHPIENAAARPAVVEAQRLVAPTGNNNGVDWRSTKLNDCGHTQWPRYMPKPSEMIINRSPIFYCSTFPLKPGFAARHILNVLRSRPDAGQVLYAAIFNPRNNPIGRASNMMQPRHVMIPQVPLSIPRKHQQMIPLLESVVRRAKSCPYNKLLNFHCPLPRLLRKDAPGAGHCGCGGGDVPGGAQPRPPQLVPDEEKDLSTLMNELYEIEQRADHAHHLQQQQHERQIEAAGTAAGGQAAGSAASVPPLPHHGRRRGKLTGLGQLVLEAESQLDSALISHSEDLNHRVGPRSDPVAARRTQPAITVTATGGSARPIIVSESGLPSTQPQEDGHEEGNLKDVDASLHHPKRPALLFPLLHTTKQNTTSSSTLSPESLSSCFVPHEQVTRFVWAVLRRIVPAVMLGDKKSRRALHKSLRKFISLRRFEQMNVNQVIQKQRVSSMHWISSPNSLLEPSSTARTPKENKTIPANQAAAHQRVLILWSGWLFSAVVVPLLRTHFFCTESEAYRQQVFYYRKPVWVRLASAAIDGLLGTQFAPLPSAKAQRILECRRLGVAGLRLLPKRVGMRFIVNMGKRAKVVFKAPQQSINEDTCGAIAGLPAAGGRPPLPSTTRLAGRKHPRQEDTHLTFVSVNSMLGGVHQILKLEASRQPAAFGASVFGYNDTYCKLQPYIRTWKAAAAAAAAGGGGGKNNKQQKALFLAEHPSHSKPSLPPPSYLMPYIVSVDVSRAFDHVDVATLLDLVTQLLQSEKYLVVKYSEIVPCMGDIKVLPRKLAVPADGAHSNEIMKDFPSRAAQWALTRKGKVFVDGVVYEQITRIDALHILKQHLTANLVKLKKIWHYQCRGIAQGSTLSTLLCCLYLAHVERVCLMPIINSYRPSSAFSISSLPPRNDGSGGGGGGGGSLKTSSLGGTGGGLTALAAAAGSRDTPTCQHQNVNNNRMASVHRQATPTSTGTAAAGAIHSVLLRLVDDWLLVTTHRSVAEEVAKCMLGGIPAYNIVVNPDKTKLSFQLKIKNTRCGGSDITGGGGGGMNAALNAVVEPSVYTSSDGSTYVKWCGLLLNTNTLEIMGDYTRYTGEHISTSLTIPMKKGMGAALGSKLCHYLRPKVHPLLLDPSINSPTTIRVNVYQAFMIGAMKFHCYVRAMPVAPTATSKVLFNAIEIGIAFMVKLTRPRRVAAALRPSVTVLCDPGLSPANVRYLGLHAFKTVLGRKQASYVALLKEIEEALALPACARCARALAPAVDAKKSTILDAIIY
ncbi:putative Telomerase reverse transcriptase [Nannochloris sp. 'desiccata']|nr:putative Telomerase reverse transcriptase [Chlorella desiccata (nom. nud.)]